MFIQKYIALWKEIEFYWYTYAFLEVLSTLKPISTN